MLIIIEIWYNLRSSCYQKLCLCYPRLFIFMRPLSCCTVFKLENRLLLLDEISLHVYFGISVLTVQCQCFYGGLRKTQNLTSERTAVRVWLAFIKSLWKSMEMTEEEMSIDWLTISQPGIHQSVVTSGKAKSDWFKVPYIRKQHHLFQKHSQIPSNPNCALD